MKTKSANHKLLMLIFSMVWLLMMLFSYEYVGQKHNDKNALKLAQIEQQKWHLNWTFSSASDLVGEFADDWQIIDEGIKSELVSPELSLYMNGVVIDPEIQQALLLDVQMAEQTSSEATFKLEFSNQREQIYYVSNDLSVNELNDVIQLNELRWQILKQHLLNSNDTIIEWTDIPVIDALVIRFYFKQSNPLIVHQIQLLQSKADIGRQYTQTNCEPRKHLVSRCFITNQMRYLQDQQQRSNDKQLTHYLMISELPALMWLVIAGGMLILALFVFNQTSKSVVFSVMGVFTIITLLHQQWIEDKVHWVQWPILALVMGLFWYKRHDFKIPSNPAWPIWLISAFVAVVLLLVFNQQQSLVPMLSALPLYFLWAWVQQLLLGPVFAGLLIEQMDVEHWLVALLVGILFSVIHAPNHMLMIATLLGGTLWSYSWLKYKNIYANAFSHALLASVFYQIMPQAWLGSARIGVFF